MKNFFLLMAAFISLQGTAQNTKPKPTTEVKTPKETEVEIYSQALKYGDMGVAVHSLYALIVKHPEITSYKDSLAQIYFQSNSYSQCIRVCLDLLLTKPNDTTVLRMLAMSYQNSGGTIDAISTYDKVVKLTGNAYDSYQKAALEYRIKRLVECKISIEFVIAKAKDNEKITLYIDQDKKQEVSLRAAAFNLYGMVAKDFNDTASARFLFSKAIELTPDFYFALSNLKALNEASGKPQSPVPAKENTPADNEKKK